METKNGRAVLARRVAAQIERTRSGQRKHVVEGRVAIRKLDRRPRRDREDVRHELLVALIHARVGRRVAGRRQWGRRLEIDDHAAAINGHMRGAAEPPDEPPGVRVASQGLLVVP